MNPNDNGVTSTPQNSALTEVQQLRRMVTELSARLDNQPSNLNPVNETTANTNFNDKYWFTSLQMVTVQNPAWFRPTGQGEPVTHDYEFMVEMRHFRIPAGKSEKFPGVIANVYLDGMSRIVAQNEEKLSFMGDPVVKKLYYDRLILDVENLAPEYNPVPAYLRNVAPSAVGTPADDTPPWESGMERARDVAPNAPPQQTETPPDPPKLTEDKTTEFELEGKKYKQIIQVSGKRMHFIDGKLSSEADYSRAASML